MYVQAPGFRFEGFEGASGIYQKSKEEGGLKSLIVCGDFNLPEVNWPEAGCWVNHGGQEEEDFLN